MDTKRIGQQIKKARISAGMTQKELAEKLGIPYQGIGQWERGIRTPKLETLQRIAAAMGVPVESILDPAMFSTDSSPVAPLDVLANELAVPVDVVRRVFQSVDPATEEARQLFGYVRALLTEEIPSDVLQRIQRALYQLNTEGRNKAVERVEELTEIPKYRYYETPPEAQDGPPEAK